jgi:predicted NBD/HSP70 family sugar kinase
MEFEDTVRQGVRPLPQLGKNQAGMRDFNERLVLSLVRRHGALAKSAIARMTGLSAQTVSVIMRHLEADGLLKRGEPVRGRVGQPTVPLSIDPDGAFFIGAKVGRRSLEVVLVDFLGGVRHAVSHAYAYPNPHETILRLRQEVGACAELLGPAAERIAGLGIAMPFRLWEWAEQIGAEPAVMDAWRQADIRHELEEALPWPVYLQNDGTAACGAELVFGNHAGLDDFIYFHVGAFVGGGVVLGGGLFAGRTGNAGAIGSCPVPGSEGRLVQLLDRASLILLERELAAAGVGVEGLYDGGDWSGFGTHLDSWIQSAGHGIAHAIAAAASVIDFETALIDGALPTEVRERLVERTGAELDRLDLAGVDKPQLMSGTIGARARALGGAALPLFDRYLLDQHALAGVGT